jgi:hypothetical protein
MLAILEVGNFFALHLCLLHRFAPMSFAETRTQTRSGCFAFFCSAFPQSGVSQSYVDLFLPCDKQPWSFVGQQWQPPSQHAVC